MSGYACSIGAAKGGVGKTTVVANVGVALTDEGYDVVIVDGDLKMPNLDSLVDVESEATVHSVLSGEASLNDALVESQSGAWVVPGDRSLDAYSNTEPSELGAVIRELTSEFDVVLVDTGSGLTDETAVALAAADGVLCLSKPSDSSIADARKTIELVDRADGNALGSLLTCASRADQVDSMRDEFDVPLLGVVPSDRDVITDEPAVHNSPDSDVAEAYRILTESLERIMFEDADGEDLEMAFVEGWVDGDLGDDNLESGDESGAFGLF